MQELDDQLFRAIKTKNLELCRTLIGQGADVNAIDHVDGTFLLKAVSVGRLDICRVLLENGANVHKGSWREKPIERAAWYGSVKMFNLLMEFGATLNGVDKDGKTLLMLAARGGHAELCSFLVREGVDVNHRDDVGWTALLYAIDRNSMDCCRLLVEAGAHLNVMANGDQNWTSLTKAAYLRRVELCRLLVLHGADTTVRLKMNGLTSFQLAVQGGKTEVVKFFLDECGESPNQATDKGVSVMQIAKSAAVKRLLHSAMTQEAIRKELDCTAGSDEQLALEVKRSSISPL